jgi:hypothetical protein
MTKKIDTGTSKLTKDAIRLPFPGSKPANEEEKKLKKSIEDVIKKGYFIQIPND